MPDSTSSSHGRACSADNSVGKVIDGLLRHDVILIDEVGFAPLDATGTQLLLRFIAADIDLHPWLMLTL